MIVLRLAMALVGGAPAESSTTARDGIELAWTTAAPACPDADEVLDAALEILGPARPSTPLRAKGRVEHDVDGFTLELVVEGDSGGTRRLHAQSCDALARFAALVLALAVDPSVLSRAVEDSPQIPEPEVDSTIAPETAAAEPSAAIEPASAPVRAAPRRVEPPPRDRRLHVGVLVELGVGLRALPGIVSGAFGLAGTVGGRLWRVELGANYWTPSDRASPRNPSVGGRFQIVGGHARGCVVPAVRTLEIPVCAGLLASAMLAQGTGELAPARRSAAAWVAVLAGPGLLWLPRRAGGRVGLGLRSELLATILQPEFATAPSGLVWAVPRLAIQVLAGVEVRFSRAK